MFNIHELAYDIPQFTWKITTYPDLIHIFGMKNLLQEADQVLTLQDPPSPQLHTLTLDENVSQDCPDSIQNKHN